MTVTSGASADAAFDAGSTDARLELAFRLVASAEVRALSVDVFDTMLWRLVPDPADAFPLVGRRLEQRGVLGGDLSPRAFAALRRAAEAQARAKRNVAGAGLEVTLADIYAELPLSATHGAPPLELARTEIEVEKELLVPDLDVLELVRFARALGRQVVAVSETYLSEAELRELIEPYFDDETAIDHVVVSSAHGRGKAAGLWEIVLRELGLDPRQMVHVGDNREADVEASRRIGIPSVWFERRPPTLEKALERERHYVTRERLTENGDAGLAAMRSKVLYRTELAGLDPELQPFWRYGAATLGPAFAGFAEWVVARAEAFGAARVFCLMREGELLADLVNAAADAMGSEVRAEPIWLSRQVCARASIIDGSEQELRELLGRRRAPTVAELCATLGLDPRRSPRLRELVAAHLDDPAAMAVALGELSSNPELRTKIVESSRLIRARVLELVHRALPTSDSPFVLVDLGWGATIQYLVHRLLDRQPGGAPPMAGLYLLTQEAALPRALDGLHIEGFLGSFGEPAGPARAVMRSPEILEQVCMPDVGSQVGLTSELEPVLSEAVDERLPQAAHRAAAQKGIRAFQREWVRYASEMPGRRASLTARNVRDLLLAQLARGLVAPTREEATVFGSWIHDENFGSLGSEPVAGGPDALRGVRHMEPSQLFELPMSELYWPFGLAALVDEELAAVAEAVTMGLLPKEAFYSVVEAGELEIYYDNGFGFGEDWKTTIQSRRNRFGLSYARVTVRAEEVRGVRIDPARAPCLVRIDWISLTCHVRGETEPRRLVFDDPAALARFASRGMRPLLGTLYAAVTNDPQLELDLRRELGGAIAYEVLVEVAYAVFLTDVRESAGPLQLRRRRQAKAVKRFVRQLENRTGLPLGRPLRKAWRRVRRLRRP